MARYSENSLLVSCWTRILETYCDTVDYHEIVSMQASPRQARSLTSPLQVDFSLDGQTLQTERVAHASWEKSLRSAGTKPHSSTTYRLVQHNVPRILGLAIILPFYAL